MNLKRVIEDAARSALKNQETEILGTLRMLLSAVKNREIEKRSRLGKALDGGGGGASELTDEEITAVLRAEAKKRKDAAGEFEKAGRTDLAEKEKKELAILERYLPAELSDEEIEKLLMPVAQGASVNDFGRVMGAAMKVIAGRASGDRVGAIAKRLLGKQ